MLTIDFFVETPVEPTNPCNPSPCGPNSQCKELNNQAICSCLPEYVGSPPSCRPECVISNECNRDKACILQKCKDPCPGMCGHNANCQTMNHSPICTCTSGYTGDPFTQCYPIPSMYNYYCIKLYNIKFKLTYNKLNIFL